MTLSTSSVLIGTAHAAQPPAAGAAASRSDAAGRGAAGAAPTTAAKPQPKFAISEFIVLGDHLLPPEVVERAVYPFLGPQRDLKTVQMAVTALEQAYRRAGYGTVFVDIPQQDVTNGVVRLQITEGTIERVQVHGERYFSGRAIRAALPALRVGHTPNLPALQQQLGALNSYTPDRLVTPVLKAGSEPGTVDVDLAVKDTLPLHGFVQYDDRHTADTTPDRVTGSLSYDNLWQRQDTLGITYQTAPADVRNAEVWVANYLAHVGAGIAAFSYIRTSSNVLALGTLGVLGQGSIYGAHWQQTLTNTVAETQGLDAGVDYKDVDTEVFTGATATAGAGTVTAPVKYLNWSLVYTQSWRHAQSAFGYSAGAAFGIRSLINSTDQFENARYNARADYIDLRVSMNAAQNLPAGFSVRERMSSQWSPNPLVNNEQYSLGGEDTVRGYLEAEALGDSGVAGTFEVHSPAPLPAKLPVLAPVYGYLFADGGVASVQDPLHGQIAMTSLWSYGAGLRLDTARGFAGYFELAVPGANGVRTRRGHAAEEFMVRYAF
ncbi:MAG TPA: ShlB/FhaC/HecB family hemolysin secretion/activation protein [Steroidobacteraceae bacterium]|nr:ShlB/FhaC/HecB family hemolysin secretion/activation protein [Steroidobacteraceae bacterium]